jgi:hypothetical protein
VTEKTYRFTTGGMVDGWVSFGNPEIRKPGKTNGMDFS